MFICPITGCRLQKAKVKGGMFWYSPESAGRFMNLSMVKHYLGEHAASEIWMRAAGSELSRYKCPGCQTPMKDVMEPGWIGPHRIEVCRGCGMVWFDKGEHPEIPHHTDIDPKVEELKKNVSLIQSEVIGLEGEAQSTAEPHNLIEGLPAFLMLPVKTFTAQFPAKTLLILAAGLFFLKPSEAGHFTHIVFLVLNAYFFYLFSSDVEGELSPVQYLVFTSTSFLGSFFVCQSLDLHFTDVAMAPTVLSMAVLAVLLPLKARFSFLFPVVHYMQMRPGMFSRMKSWRWIRMPQWLVVVFYLILLTPWFWSVKSKTDGSFILLCLLGFEVLWAMIFRYLLREV